jgi:hypothetical protein
MFTNFQALRNQLASFNIIYFYKEGFYIFLSMQLEDNLKVP